MFSQNERAEIRSLFYDELINLHDAMQRAGSYRYLCLVHGKAVYSHHPIGKVLWHNPW